MKIETPKQFYCNFCFILFPFITNFSTNSNQFQTILTTSYDTFITQEFAIFKNIIVKRKKKGIVGDFIRIKIPLAIPFNIDYFHILILRYSFGMDIIYVNCALCNIYQ